MLIDGEWVDDDSVYRNAEGGAFVRPSSEFRNWVTSDGGTDFEAEAGRYHLFLAPNCPWAHRAQIVRQIKGLEKVISVSLSDIPRTRSWAYSKGIGRGLDLIAGVFELHQAYQAANPNYTGRVTVPTLWDKKLWTIVNNESSDIIRMFNTEFNQWGNADVDLFPEPLRDEIEGYNNRIYPSLNNGD